MPTTLDRPRKKKLPSLKPGIAKARIAYLYGVNGNAPIVHAKELAVIAGTNAATISRHVQKWRIEAENIALESIKSNIEKPLSVGSSSVLSVGIETIDASKKDIDFLRNQLDEIAAEIVNIDKTCYKLEQLLEKFDLDDKDFLVKGFDFYLRASLNKQNLRKQWLSHNARWTVISGVDSVTDIQVTSAKTIAVIQAKAQLGEGDKTDAENEDSVGVGFKRRIKV